jgi:hypothetical protein
MQKPLPKRSGFYEKDGVGKSKTKQGQQMMLANLLRPLLFLK